MGYFSSECRWERLSLVKWGQRDLGSGVEFLHPVHLGVCPDPPRHCTPNRHCTTRTVWNRLCSSIATCTNKEASSCPHNPEKEESPFWPMVQKGEGWNRENRPWFIHPILSWHKNQADSLSQCFLNSSREESMAKGQVWFHLVRTAFGGTFLHWK